MNNETIEMADILRQSGKIYVVIAVLSVIFIALSIYLFIQDKKLQELEKKIKDKE
jgi:hypothetical protein